ncbi:MAG TPA: hypothetical protein VGE01_03275 [Fimbriimonas sp.]
MALVAAGVLLAPILAGCGSGDSGRTGANLPPVDESMGGRAQTFEPPQEQRRSGMSTGQKVALLAGAAALYYMYRKNQQKRSQGDKSQPQYYLSKNGRVYYRDSSGRAHWVTPPREGIRIPAEEAYQYREMEGYNGQTSGRSILDMMSSGGMATDPYGRY